MYACTRIKGNSFPAIKLVALSSGICPRTFVPTNSCVFVALRPKIKFISSMNVTCQAPAGDVPIRSVSLASDGSCLVAGNNKVYHPISQRF